MRGQERNRPVFELCIVAFSIKIIFAPIVDLYKSLSSKVTNTGEAGYLFAEL